MQTKVPLAASCGQACKLHEYIYILRSHHLYVYDILRMVNPGLAILFAVYVCCLNTFGFYRMQ